MSYEPINWDEYTPITATNLDIMDMGINDNEGRISTNEDDIDVIETVSGTVQVSEDSSRDITHNLGSENVVVTVEKAFEDYFAAFLDGGYSIIDSNNIRIYNESSSLETFRYTVTRTG